MKEIKELPAYSVFDLIADFGGNVGLLCGWSLLILVSFLEHVFKTCRALCFSKETIASMKTKYSTKKKVAEIARE